MSDAQSGIDANTPESTIERLLAVDGEGREPTPKQWVELIDRLNNDERLRAEAPKPSNRPE